MRLFSLQSLTIPAALALALLGTDRARAQVTYQLDDGSPGESFNNSQGTETEDCWVANSFTAVAGGQRLVAISYMLGSGLANLPAGETVTAAIYTGSSLTNPSGLTRIVSTTTTVPVVGAGGTFQIIPLANAVTLPVGQVFYAALLMRNVPGNAFPFSNDTTSPRGRSFFDVGPTQGAAYNLDNTSNATVLGASHPVVTFAQSPGNLILRVNGVPAPGSLAVILCMTPTGLGLLLRRRLRK